MNASRSNILCGASFMSAAAVFVFGSYVELGVATPILYVASIWFAYASRRPRWLVTMAVIVSVLTVVGLFVSPVGGDAGKGAINRCIALSVIWLTTMQCRRLLSVMTCLEQRTGEAETLAAENERRRCEQQERSRAMLSVAEDLRFEQLKLSHEVEERRNAQKALAESERYLRTIIETTPNGILMVDAGGKIVMINSQIEAMFGYGREELLGRLVETLIPARFARRHPGLRHEYFAEPQARAMGEGRELFGLRKDGAEFPIELGLNPILTEHGFCVLSSIVDITWRKRAEQSLVRSEHRTRSILDSALDAVVIIDAGGRITGWNPQAEVIFGLAHHEVIGRDLADTVIPLRYREAHRTGLARFLETGEGPVLNQRIELVAMRQNLEEFPIELCVLPIQLDDGYEFCAFVRDITERVESRRRLEAFAEDLRRSNRELEQFAYVASHDLQEPLRKVASCCQALAEDYADQLDDDAREWIGYAVDGATRMRRLVSDLLAYSRVATKGQTPVPVASEDACRMALSNLQQAIDDSAAEIVVHPLPQVRADETQLVQLFQNLIGNALKYRGGATPTIEVDAEADGDKWRFSVSDNGIGIEPQYAKRIFVIFQRLHRKEEYSGTGIGLSICEKIVQRHGGEIWVESSPGQGSTFFFTLPATGVQDHESSPLHPAAAAD